MELPSATDPEGMLVYLIAILLVASVVFLGLFATGVWVA